MSVQTKATIEDLMRIKGKAELIDGEIFIMPPTGWAPNYAATEITISLRAYAKRQKRGFAVGDNAAFRVFLPRRQSCSPDSAYYEGANPGMKFFTGAPRFAAEVRSMGDYGDSAEQEMAAKRVDYFAAGTLVVWDVDLLSDQVVRVYRATNPLEPTIFQRGQTAEAEPAVPGWSMTVDELFEA